jgi:hypothetical protein
VGLSWLKHFAFHDRQDRSVGEASSPPEKFPMVLRTKEQSEGRLSLRAWNIDLAQAAHGKTTGDCISSGDRDGLCNRVGVLIDTWEPGIDCRTRDDYVLELAGHLNRKLGLQVNVWSFLPQAGEADILLDDRVAINIEMEPRIEQEGRRSRGEDIVPPPGDQLSPQPQHRAPFLPLFRQQGYPCGSFSDNGRASARGVNGFPFPNAARRPR